MACNRVTAPISKVFPRPRAIHHLNSVRLISSQSVQPPRQFLIQIPDRPDTQEIRARTKQAHIAECTSLIESGKLSYFGVTLSSHPEPDEAARISGSLMVLEAEDETSVREFLKRDAYTRAGVWDIKKAQIWPFKSG